MSPVKVIAPGRTPMERLTNFTKSVVAVPKDEVERAEKEWRTKRRKAKTKR
jgi:hypothetical protein